MPLPEITSNGKDAFMSRHSISAALALLVAALSLGSTGCVTKQGGPYLGVWSVPIPVPAYLQKHEEDQFWEQERYARAPILGPIPAGGPTTALDPPSDDEVMRTFEHARPVQGGIPLLHERQLNNIRIVKDKIADYIDPVRVYPLIGPAQLHHAHYKCTVYFTETTRVGWPVPYTTVDEDAAEVIYIDHNHLHMAGNVDCGPGSGY